VQQAFISADDVNVPADDVNDTWAIMWEQRWQADMAPMLHGPIKDVDCRAVSDNHAARHVDVKCQIAEVHWHSVSVDDLSGIQYMGILTAYECTLLVTAAKAYCRFFFQKFNFSCFW